MPIYSTIIINTKDTVIKTPNNQTNTQAVFSVIGGLIFLTGAAFFILFAVVDIIMLVQGDSPSLGLLISLAAVTLLGWGIVRLSKATLRSVIDAITNNLN